MIKYKIIGALNFLFGLIILSAPLGITVFVLPRLAAFYAEAGMDSQSIILKGYGSFMLALMVCLANFWIGYKLWSKNDKDKYFNWGILILITTLLLTGV